MIKSFKNKNLEKFYKKGDSSGINPQHVEKIQFILNALNSATKIEDLNAPSFRLHRLKGKMKYLYSITVKNNWRITFEFINGDAYILNYLDYH